MQRLVLDMQNFLMSDAIAQALHSDGDFMVEIAQRPKDTVKKCSAISADAVILEVTGYTPWKLCERMKIRDELHKTCPDCKIVFLVDENSEKEAAEQVKTAKKDGLIDMFLYASTSASFLTAIVDAL